MTVHCAKLLFSRKNLEDKTELLPFNLLQYELSLEAQKPFQNWIDSIKLQIWSPIAMHLKIDAQT